MLHQKIRCENHTTIEQSLEWSCRYLKTNVHAYICWINIFMYLFCFLDVFTKSELLCCCLRKSKCKSLESVINTFAPDWARANAIHTTQGSNQTKCHTQSNTITLYACMQSYFKLSLFIIYVFYNSLFCVCWHKYT